MFATIINCLAVIAGGLLGLLLAGNVKEKYRAMIFDGAGITTLVIGVGMALKSGNPIYLAISLIAGGLLGALVDIDGGILRLGNALERLTLKGKARPSLDDGAVPQPSQKGWDFGHGFLNASVLFCVGAMALVGSFKAGTEGDYTLILTKSVLDGFMAIIFAAAMGPGVLFSALSLLVYQGLLTLGAVYVKPWVSPMMLTELTGAGGALVLMIALNLLDLKKIKTANFLPALVLMVVLVLFDPAIARLASHLGL